MRYAWLLVVVAACFQSNEVVCEDGRICPEQTTCLELAASNQLLCGRDDDVAACRDAAELDACTVHDGMPGACYAATTGGLVCQPNGCGNSITDPGEVCDDGNAVAGDRCSYSCRSNETCGNGLIDPIRLVADQPMLNELCDDANLLGRDGCTSGCDVEAPRWQAIEISSGPTLANHRMTYDPVRRGVVMFGGETDSGALRNAVWEWDGVAWSRSDVAVAPSARRAHAFAYDLVSRQLLAFGGSTGLQSTGDFWRWDGDAWTALAPAVSPSPRHQFGTAYDTRRKRLIVFGGESVSPADTWEWNGVRWRMLPTPPSLQPTRSAPAMAYDPVRDRIVLAGGELGVSSARDTWELDGDSWVQVADATTTPADLRYAAMAYDTAGRRMLVYGGGGTPDVDPIARTLAWDGQQWTDLGQTAPGPRRRAAIASDPARGEIVMHGGHPTGCSGPSCTPTSDTWIWNGSGWSRPPAAGSPGRRSHMAAAYDPERGTLVVFGGIDGAASPLLLGDTWELTQGHWTRVATTGPAPRLDAAMAYDAAHHRMVLFGGKRLLGAMLPAETWLWDGTTWSLAAPTTSPPARAQTAMAGDVARGRVVLFGGTGPLSDTWEWDGTTWLERQPLHAPPGRRNHQLAYDPRSRTVLAFGGVVTGPTTAAGSDTWTWDGTDWTQAASSGIAARLNSAIAWNPARRRLTLFGGFPGLGSASAIDDTWEWDGLQWRQVFALMPPPGRQFHIAFPAPDGTGVAVYGGDDGTVPGNAPARFDDLWRLTYAGREPYEQCAAGVDRDGDGLSACSDPDCGFRCDPFCVASEIGSAACMTGSPRCGDGVCSGPRESCRLCPGDCGACVGACGDGFCDPGEACLGDCP